MKKTKPIWLSAPPFGRLVARALPRGQFGRGVTVLAGSTAAAQAIVIVSSPLITRLFSPSDLGVLAVYASLVGIINIVSGLRYELAIPLPASDEEAVNVVALNLTVTLMTSAALGVLVLLLGRSFGALLHLPTLSPYAWLIPFAVMGAGTYQALYFFALRKKAFGTVARTRLNQSIGRVACQSTLGVLRIAPLGLLLADFLGSTIGIGSLLNLLRSDNQGLTQSISRAGMLRAAKRYVRFPMLSTSSGLLAVAGMATIPIFLTWTQGTEVAGWYALTQRVIGLPVTVIGVAVGETYFGMAAGLARTNPAALRSLFKSAALRLFLAGIAPTVIVVAAGPVLFSTLFGSSWTTAGLYARYLAPAFLAMLVTSPLAMTANFLERQDLQLITDGARAALVVGVFVVAHRLSWGASATILALSAALLASYGIYFGMYWFLLRGIDAAEPPCESHTPEAAATPASPSQVPPRGL